MQMYLRVDHMPEQTDKQCLASHINSKNESDIIHIIIISIIITIRSRVVVQRHAGGPLQNVDQWRERKSADAKTVC